ncbi:amylo-alpha-1,6-glucosidase [Nitrospirillum sp. BR 11163]|uniref:amylo-alpha-1,6-glucosidase n=1 Tax=Nitrospirillum sp. BR 11163 TaxID=3104323 RepID=UPI002B000273|nr:amylo-alpha-1,6-glucosidase [Nitrospirillum sp. BR 11163]MEA1672630.1 amylo-alpha-1,6-glucosidase [Nitrospirillum sp. BR 11163]
MAALDERQLDPAIGLAGPDGSGPRETFRLFALKHGDCFVVADAHGDIQGQGDGLFVDDTRILSRYQLRIGDKEPSLLGASLSEDNILFTANSTNVPMPAPGGGMTLWGVIHIERTRILWQNRLYERVTLSNFGGSDIVVPLTFNFAADFRDMFEVRGSTRQLRGRTHEAQLSGDGVTLSYEGLDQVTRQSTLSFSQAPDRLQGDRAVFNINLPKRGCHVLYIEVGTERTDTPSRVRFRAAAVRARLEMRTKRRRGASVYSSGRVFNDWLARAQADTALLTTELSTGPYPYAGIPWFSTAFGRDGIISALQMMWLNPRLARGVLAFLATHQATETAPFSDAQPGKILHETRKGEMAVLRELPFGRYYGSVDTTPLYIYLASVYADRTGDMAFIDQLWPSLCAAASWMEGAGDQNGDGFVDYQRAEESGLANQGWKDSFDSIQHADGSLPEGPVALVEVQGYVYAAYCGLARLAKRRGEDAQAAYWQHRAEALRQAVETHFWMEDMGFYALALDGKGKPCRVRASNVGHLLFVGLPSPERAHRVADQLLAGAFHTGWGIRTLADTEVCFNPMSYHNGSVWPHDTAICAAGLARYGVRGGVVKLMSDTFEAAVRFGMRLPELFCGFPREQGETPIAYPVACVPQAWAAGSVFMLLQACLGIEIDGWRGEIHVNRPKLPIGIDQLTVRRVTVGEHTVDLFFQRMGGQVIASISDHEEGLVPLIVRS